MRVKLGKQNTKNFKIMKPLERFNQVLNIAFTSIVILAAILIFVIITNNDTYRTEDKQLQKCINISNNCDSCFKVIKHK